jgi:hypothetical protein
MSTLSSCRVGTAQEEGGEIHETYSRDEQKAKAGEGNWRILQVIIAILISLT